MTFCIRLAQWGEVESIIYIYSCHKPIGLRLPEDVRSEIEPEQKMRGTTFSAAAISLLREAIRMRRVLGIHSVEAVAGLRRAAVVGTGLEVWEIVRTYKEVGKDYSELRRSYPWLSEPQLRAPLSYYELYPGEMEARLKLEASWTPQRVRTEMLTAGLPNNRPERLAHALARWRRERGDHLHTTTHYADFLSSRPPT
jgi:uncharacterized protein (DUF433 family)